MFQERITTETSQQEGERLLQADRDRRARRYTVERLPDWHMRTRQGLPFGLRKYGPGHWCVGEGVLNAFATEDAAEAAGKAWVETGRAN